MYYSTAGATHVLCVSGLHVGLVLGGLLIVLRMIGTPVSWLPAVITPILLFYGAMTGFGPAVLRATVMALMLLWGHRLGRERDWPTTLALAALIILALNPLQLYEVGFQLSFAATWGILYLGPWLQEKMEKWRLPGWIKSILQVTVSAQLGTLAHSYTILQPGVRRFHNKQPGGIATDGYYPFNGVCGRGNGSYYTPGRAGY